MHNILASPEGKEQYLTACQGRLNMFVSRSVYMKGVDNPYDIKYSA